MEDERKPDETAMAELADLIFEDVDDAADALSEDEREAYREAQRSVVHARRQAEVAEGLLRIN